MKHRLATIAAAVVLCACAAGPAKKDLAFERIQADLQALLADDELQGRAPLAVAEARRAVRAAGEATGDTDRKHRMYMADRRVQIARASARVERLGEELQSLERERNQLLVTAAKLEAEQARREAARARLLSETRAEEAQRALEEAQQARQYGDESSAAAERARQEAEQARKLAEAQTRQAELAKREAELAGQAVDDLQRQLQNIRLKESEQGVVVTLGDVLFETAQAELRASASDALDDVVELLQTEPSRKVRIEGHTDSRGSESFNLDLSQRRADSVREALMQRGVEGSRMTAIGLGEEYPVASNEDEAGRARNRRVDVILLDQ